MESGDCVIALDLGGTKLASAVVNAGGELLYQKKIAVERGSVGACVKQIAEAIQEAHGAAVASNIQGAGIVVPGIYFADKGNVWAPNLWGDEQVPLQSDLERFVKLPIRIDSDRAGCVLGEQWLGVARGIDDVVFVAVGTGIGAGIVSGGCLLRGSMDIAGAVGWFVLNPELKPIYKKIGCWEAEAAGPALARRTGAQSAEEVIAAARTGEISAQNAILETAQYLGMGIANIVSILNPEMIVLGGGLMQRADLFLDTIKRVMFELAQPIAAKQVRIEVTSLGENAALFGAARIAFGF